MNDLRQRISSAARELYVSEGIEGLSMRKVADMVGVSAPAIYRHFRNKDELLNEIVVEALRLLEDYLQPALERDTSFERLIAMTENYLDFAIERPRFFDFAFLTPSLNVGSIPEEIEKRNFTTFRFAIEQVAACMEEGYLERQDPLQTAITIWAEVHGLVTLFRTGRFGPDAEAFRRTYRGCVQRVLSGMKGPAFIEPILR